MEPPASHRILGLIISESRNWTTHSLKPIAESVIVRTGRPAYIGDMGNCDEHGQCYQGAQSRESGSINPGTLRDTLSSQERANVLIASMRRNSRILIRLTFSVIQAQDIIIIGNSTVLRV